MVKLASARETRAYGTRLSRNRLEYINAGLYVFATILLTSGFAAQFSSEPRSGLVILMMGYAIVTMVNAHDLVAHLSGVDYRFSLMRYDLQLGLVEFAVPLVYGLGTLLFFVATLFLFIQANNGGANPKQEHWALNMLIAGSILWLLGSIHNACQIYERADAHVQILQETVLIPFLISSSLFLVGSIINSREQVGKTHHHGLELLGGTWVWISIFGSLILFLGGLANVVRVFKMQQGNGLRLEKLRGGAQERLIQTREGLMPLITGEQRRLLDAEKGQTSRTRSGSAAVQSQARYEDVLRRTDDVRDDGQTQKSAVVETPYKDVLVRDQSQAA